MNETEEKPKVSRKNKIKVNEDISMVTPEDLAMVHRTLQRAYVGLRRENRDLLKFVNNKFKKHPMKRKGEGWIFHRCDVDCYRRVYGYGIPNEFVHHQKWGER